MDLPRSLKIATELADEEDAETAPDDVDVTFSSSLPGKRRDAGVREPTQKARAHTHFVRKNSAPHTLTACFGARVLVGVVAGDGWRNGARSQRGGAQ